MKTWARTSSGSPRVPQVTGDTSKLMAELPSQDVVVCLLPLTAETRGLINAEFLGRMKPGAALINAARGAHVVEDDLLAALDTGACSFAALAGCGDCCFTLVHDPAERLRCP